MMAKVTVEQGDLIGGKTATEEGFEYYEFLNIPFAKPPVGNLRFKSPQPPEPWHGERDATSENPDGFCRQFHMLQNVIMGSEDCLYLNVFTTKLPSRDFKPRPVMVCIHGGGFILGSGTIKKELSSPDYLIRHGVVIVCINYRLGPFGFLCLDIPEVAGNMGLKDQVMALKWVQENISKFGGDKDNVTIFGVSAGGASVEYLLLTPLSSGLFHKAIMQSGSALNHWAINTDIKNLSLQLAENLGCKAQDIYTVYNYLLEVPVDQIAQASFALSGFLTKKQTCFGFVPTVEKDFGNGEAFITDYPYNIMKDKKFHDVPMIKGFCEFEGLMTLAFKSHVVKELMDSKKMTQQWNHSIDESYDELFVKVYFDEYVKKDEDIPEQQVINFSGDLDFASGIWISSKLLSEKTTPTYVYLFSYNNKFSMLELFKELNKNLADTPQPTIPSKKRGACHGDDIFYVMRGNNELKFTFKESDVKMMQKLTKIWTDFAKTSDPTPNVSDLVPIKWPAFTKADEKYMQIDNELQIKSQYYPSKMTLFEEIYDKYRM